MGEKLQEALSNTQKSKILMIGLIIVAVLGGTQV
jgi:hypothetical protein